MLKAPLLGIGQMMDFDLFLLPLTAQVTFIHYVDEATCKSLLIQKEVIGYSLKVGCSLGQGWRLIS